MRNFDKNFHTCIIFFLSLAELDASHEDHWFDALKELIGHLQERRVWMSEVKPADVLDDDFLFPMGDRGADVNNSIGGGGDSDVESTRVKKQFFVLKSCINNFSCVIVIY